MEVYTIVMVPCTVDDPFDEGGKLVIGTSESSQVISETAPVPFVEDRWAYSGGEGTPWVYAKAQTYEECIKLLKEWLAKRRAELAPKREAREAEVRLATERAAMAAG